MRSIYKKLVLPIYFMCLIFKYKRINCLSPDNQYSFYPNFIFMFFGQYLYLPYYSRLLLLGIITISITACQPKSSTSSNFQHYKVGPIPNNQQFLSLNAEEQQLVLSIPDDNIRSGSGAFKNNRSRIYFDRVMNKGAEEKLDSSVIKELSLSCSCYLSNDTLKIHSGMGMMGGFGLYINVYQQQAISKFYIYTDDIKPYKSSLADTAFQSYALVSNQLSQLILDKKPNFEPGEQLSGLLSFKTLPIYERKTEDENTLESRTIEGRIHFTCKSRKKMPWEP
jgi:hypothetical protein